MTRTSSQEEPRKEAFRLFSSTTVPYRGEGYEYSFFLSLVQALSLGQSKEEKVGKNKKENRRRCADSIGAHTGEGKKPTSSDDIPL